VKYLTQDIKDYYNKSYRSQLARQRSSTVAHSSTNREKLKLFFPAAFFALLSFPQKKVGTRAMQANTALPTKDKPYNIFTIQALYPKSTL